MRGSYRDEQDISVEGVDYCVEFRVGLEATRERYGSDADGRRGELRTFVDADATLLKVQRYDEDGMTDLPIETLDPALRTQLTEKALDLADPRVLDDEDDAAYDDYCDRLRDERDGY